jgi:hypothetical protein
MTPRPSPQKPVSLRTCPIEACPVGGLSIVVLFGDEERGEGDLEFFPATEDGLQIR